MLDTIETSFFCNPQISQISFYNFPPHRSVDAKICSKIYSNCVNFSFVFVICSNMTFNHLTCLARRGVENALVSITLAYNSPRSVAILQIYITSLKRQFRDFPFSIDGGPGVVLHLESVLSIYCPENVSLPMETFKK